MAAIQGNQKGFWVKRASDTNPTFVSVGGIDTPDSTVEQSKKEWASRTGATGDLAGNNVQWVGDDPAKIYEDVATGKVKAFTPAAPDVVEDTYFDTLLKNTQDEFKNIRINTSKQYGNLVQSLKENRALYNEDLERTYGKALQKANQNAYSMGVGDSGIKINTFRDMASDKAFENKQQDLALKQKEAVADLDYKKSLDTINANEKSAYAKMKSPYASFSY